jgi:UDP-galactopyranose mutase
MDADHAARHRSADLRRDAEVQGSRVTLRADYVVVGSGLTGATIARALADAGRNVIVIEARNRVGGNVADSMHHSGIRYNLFGPHYFRTSSDRIRDFALRFSEFYPFSAKIMSQVGAEFFHWPLHRRDFDRFAGKKAAVSQLSSPVTSNFETEMLRMVPAAVYETFIAGYSQKQWGVHPSALDADLAKRIEIRDDGDTRLSKALFQALPVGGFSAWVQSMLMGIEVRLSSDFHAIRPDVTWRKKLIYTGPIDRYFGFSLGRLPYRTQHRSTVFMAGIGSIYPCGQINLPLISEGDHVRTIEWRHMLAPSQGRPDGTLLTVETPSNAADWKEAEYPFPSQSARALYQRYSDLAKAESSVLFCGRLGEYRYLDMDQAIARAMMVADRILGTDP